MLCLSALIGITAPATAQVDSQLSIHGYLTQGYGIANGGTFLGVSESGTGDYRNAAMQFRYALTDKGNVTLQFSHRRLGQSPVVTDEADVKLDWAFVGHRFGDVDVRIGRTPIPAGIYNEVRDVGVVLPLYRAPFNFYLEGAFTSETVDGVVASYDVVPAAGWGLEFSGFAGGWGMINRMTIDSSYAGLAVRVEQGLGGQFWLTTPIDGLRAGVGASRQEIDQGDFAGTWKEWHASVDGTFHWFTARAEYRVFDLPILDYAAYYGYLGLHATERLTFHGQADFADLEYAPLPSVDFNDAYTAGASYAFQPNLVLKGEAHFTKGYWADAPVIDFTSDRPASVNYVVISLSTAF
ncbi:MAG TPA: hypothetical protein VGA37_13500 [Gemmatimonadales bacterium]